MKEYCSHGIVLEGGKLREFASLNRAIQHYERAATRSEPARRGG
jgi:ABC-type polysaccharide/polyol phosphate transport system ATPase subunit